MSRKKKNPLQRNAMTGMFRFFKAGHVFIFFTYNAHYQKEFKFKENYHWFKVFQYITVYLQYITDSMCHLPINLGFFYNIKYWLLLKQGKCDFSTNRLLPTPYWVRFVRGRKSKQINKQILNTVCAKTKCNREILWGNCPVMSGEIPMISLLGKLFSTCSFFSFIVYL